jgi:molybdopterin-guanine dinucleotide biosynthesis protein B
MLAKVVAFTGVSNSGKTTAIVKIAEILTKNYNVAIIKNDPKDKAKFDVEGKDSYKFYQTGANVAVVSPNRTTIFFQSPKDIDDVIKLFSNFDYILVEGLKTLELPRIGIFRDKFYEDYIDFVDVVAMDNSIDKDLVKDKIILDLNSTEELISWIDINAKVV